MDESIPWDQKCKSSKELFQIKRSVDTIFNGVELCKQTIAKRTYFGHIDPFIQTTIEGNFCPQIQRINACLEKFHLCLKDEMVADLIYFNSLKHKVDSFKSQLETQKTQFLNEIDRLSREYYYADHMHAILGVYTTLDEFTDLQCDYVDQVVKCKRLEKELSKINITSKSFEALQQHVIDLELALQQCQEQIKNDKDFNETQSKVFSKEREQYFEIQDLKAQLQDKDIAINSIEKKDFSKPVTAQILPQNVKPASKNTNFIAPGMYKMDTSKTQTRTTQLPQDLKKTNKRVPFSIGVIATTSVSRPQLKSNQLEDKVLPNNSEVKTKGVEEQRRNFKFSKNKITKMPMAVPISAREPKRTVNQSAATPLRRTVDSESTNQKPRSTIRKLYEHVSKTCFWWYPKFTPYGYKWKPKSPIVNVNTNVSMPLGNESRTTNILEPMTPRCSKHMTGNLKLLSNFVEKFLGTVKFGNDQITPILDADLEVAFRKSTCYIRDLKGNDLLTGSRGTDLYSITLQDTSTPNSICLMAKATSSQAWLWHRGLSHLNFDSINLLSKNDIVISLPKLKFVKDHLCSSCELGKAKQKSFQTKTAPSSKRRLQLLHMDLCGPMRVESINGKKYVLVIVDDYSRYTWTHFLRTKDETPEVLNDFLRLVQRGLHAQVRIVRTDKGTKFLNKTLHAYFAKEGIEHQMSIDRTSEQNSVVKRRNRTLVEAARTMRSAAKVPLFFWAEAIATSCFTQNRSLIIPRHEKTPYHIINGRKPSVKFFHNFGSLCYIVRDGENLDKMKEKGDACIFVGYSTTSKSYRVYNKRTRVIVETIHVNFDELPQMASDHVSSDPVLQCPTTVLEHDSLSPGPQSQENVPQAVKTVTTSNELDLLFSLMFDELLNGTTQVVSKSSAVTAVGAPDKRQQNTTTSTSTTVVADIPPLNIQTTQETTSQAPTITATKNTLQAKTNKEYAQVEEDELINIFSTLVQERGETSSRYVNSSNMHTFFQRHPSEHRWTKDHPLEQVIGNPSQSIRTRRQLEIDGEMCMFALTVSRTEPKNIKEAMADSAWIEAMQEELYQFDQLDVWELVDRLLCKNDINMNWIWKNKCDEENTVIHNKAIHYPDGFIDPHHPDKVYRLKKALYGLKQAPRAWYDELSNFLIHRSPRGIFINQAKYAQEILIKHGMTSCDSIGTPMATKHLDADLSGTLVDQMKYRSTVRALMYLTASRPDIVHATCYCARYQARPTEKHLTAVKRIFWYLKNTINMGLCTSRGIQFLGGDKLVRWLSKKQDCTSMSTPEAEYVSLSACCDQVLWLRTQLTDYGFHFDKIPMYYDSKAAIAISCNPVHHSHMKHIDVRYHFIKEQVEKGIVELFFVGTEYQLADLFTKAISEDRFKYLVRRLGMRCLTPEELEVLANESA
ncbi:retrovirus-related pol polyprotein from transposon TNT 1-94 [Tanacetum coccineum]